MIEAKSAVAVYWMYRMCLGEGDLVSRGSLLVDISLVVERS